MWIERDEFNAIVVRIKAIEQRLDIRDARLGPKEADYAELDKARDELVKEIAKAVPMVNAPPVDRTQRILSSGQPVTPDHLEIDPVSKQQKGYIVLTAQERAKGFVRPVRTAYVHIGKPPEGEKFEYPIRKIFPGGCGTRTTMELAIAETYARDPKFYTGAFCGDCRKHFPLDQFVWEGTTEQVGS